MVATRTAAVPPEAAASPFLSIEQTANILMVEPMRVQRVIALGALKAYRMKPEGPWNVRPADLDAYVMSGTPRLQMPPLDPDGGWYDDRELSPHCRTFEAQVRAAIEAAIPETPPTLDPFGGNEIRLPAAEAAIRKLASGPPMKYQFKLPGSVVTPFNNAGEQFVVWNMRNRVYGVAQPTGDMGKLSESSRFAKLFDSPESFRRILDEAWSRFQTSKFSVSRIYTIPGQAGKAAANTTVAASYVVPFSMLLFVRGTIEAAAF